MYRTIVLACVGLLAAAGCANPNAEPDPCALTPATDGPTRILFVGNSYTYFNNMPEILEGIATANGLQVETGLVAAGGRTLNEHAASEDTLSAIREGGWDFVFLQPQSSFGDVFLVDGQFRVRPSTGWRSGAETLARTAREAGARPILLAHWAPKATPEDQATIERNVVDGAAATGTCFLRVGPARAIAEAALGRAALYYADGFHPSPLASYLFAAVITRALSHEDLATGPLSLSGELIEIDDGVRTGTTGTLVELTEREAEAARDAVNRSAAEAAMSPTAAPVEIALPLLPDAEEAPTAEHLRGRWEGDLTLYPIPATLGLDFVEDAGALVATVVVHGGTNERRVEGAGVVVEGNEVRFAFPQGPNGTTIDFVGVLDDAETLAGTAHFRSDSGDLEGYGSWRAHHERN